MCFSSEAKERICQFARDCMRSWSVLMMGCKGKCQKRDFGKPELTFKKMWGFDRGRQSRVQNWENNVLTLGSLQKPRKERWGKREVKLKALTSEKQHAELAGFGQRTKSHTLWKASKHSAVLPWLPQICEHWPQTTWVRGHHQHHLWKERLHKSNGQDFSRR